MTQANTLTSETRPTTSVDGLEVDIFATEQEAQAAAFVAQTAHIASTGE